MFLACLSLQKKALVIRHMYKENGINLPEDTESSVVEDNEVCDVSELKASEIVIREVQHPATKSEEEVRRLDLLKRCRGFFFVHD